MTGYLVVQTTLPSEDAARELARHLVAERSAACVQIDGPIESVYRWQGEMASAQEWRLTIKLPAQAYPRLVDVIGKYHPYEVPELLALPVEAGLPAYLAWLDESCPCDSGRTGSDGDR